MQLILGSTPTVDDLKQHTRLQGIWELIRTIRNRAVRSDYTVTNHCLSDHIARDVGLPPHPSAGPAIYWNLYR